VDAQAIFVRYFLPLYPADVRDDLARARAADANPAGNPAVTAHLEDAAQRFVAMAPTVFGADSARLALDLSDASVHRLSAAITLDLRDGWARQGEPGTAESTLFNVVVHGAAYVGACIVASHGAAWRVRRPLWESLVGLKSHAGEADLAVFHWWLKSLADDALAPSEAGVPTGATLADRYRAHVEVPCSTADALPSLFVGERSLPRLKQPTYDKLYKYLRAHLPELRDLGEHFPAPERFAGFDFRWMDFHTVGEGRLALMAGASPAGLHLFWLGAGGFEKSAFIPCDAFPDPIVRIEGGRIVAITSDAGTSRVQEFLWWGV
jgi:hypothetical protein